MVHCDSQHSDLSFQLNTERFSKQMHEQTKTVAKTRHNRYWLELRGQNGFDWSQFLPLTCLLGHRVRCKSTFFIFFFWRTQAQYSCVQSTTLLIVNITVAPKNSRTKKHSGLSASQPNFERHLFCQASARRNFWCKPKQLKLTMKGLQAYYDLFSDASQQAKSQPSALHKFVCRSINAKIKCLKCMHGLWFWIQIYLEDATKLILEGKKQNSLILLPNNQGNSQKALPNGTLVQLDRDI